MVHAASFWFKGQNCEEASYEARKSKITLKARASLIMVLALIINISSINSANAAVMLSLNFPQVGLSAYGDHATYWGAQKFTAGSNSTLTSIDISIGSNSLSGVSIRSDSGNLPGATLSTWTSSTFSPASAPYVQTFTGSYAVTSGTSYWVVFHSTSAVSLYWSNSTTQSGASGWSTHTGNSGAFSNNAGLTWATDTYIKSFSLRINGSSTSTLATPSAPIATVNSSTSVSISETSTTTNASSYLVKIYSSNGTTVVDSATISSANITSTTVRSNLTPNSSYFASITAIGDNVSYSDSNESAKTAFATPKGTSTATLSGPSSFTYRTAASLTATTSGVGLVTFYSRGKRIAGCLNVRVLSTTATCNWRPDVKTNLILTAVFTPTDSNYNRSTASLSVSPKQRTTLR